MSTFFDSSALVKLYADEQGYERARGLTGIAASAIARVEVPAAIWKKHRTGELDQAAVATLIRRFEADLAPPRGAEPRFSLVPASRSVLVSASRLVAEQGLRAYDAVQLASAELARMADPDCREFACFDNDLRAAAETQGFELLPAAGAAEDQRAPDPGSPQVR